MSPLIVVERRKLFRGIRSVIRPEISFYSALCGLVFDRVIFQWGKALKAWGLWRRAIPNILRTLHDKTFASFSGLRCQHCWDYPVNFSDSNNFLLSILKTVRSCTVLSKPYIPSLVSFCATTYFTKFFIDFLIAPLTYRARCSWGGRSSAVAMVDSAKPTINYFINSNRYWTVNGIISHRYFRFTESSVPVLVGATAPTAASDCADVAAGFSAIRMKSVFSSLLWSRIWRDLISLFQQSTPWLASLFGSPSMFIFGADVLFDFLLASIPWPMFAENSRSEAGREASLKTSLHSNWYISRGHRFFRGID